MKKPALLLAALLLFMAAPMLAQQTPQWSQYMLQDFVLNPAVAGSKNYFDARLANRQQWTGVTDAPRTFALSLHGPTKVERLGVGGMVYTDNVGPTRQTGAMASFAYHLPISQNWNLGMGVSLGALQWAIDGDKIELIDGNDPALASSFQSITVFDATAGIHAYTENAYVGIAIPHITLSDVNVYASENPAGNRLQRHLIATAGYEWRMTDKIALAPSVMVKYLQPLPLKADFTLRAIYDDSAWLGLSYRTGDAAILMAGYTWRESISIGYAYDFTITELRNYTGSTHELVLGFRMNQ